MKAIVNDISSKTWFVVAIEDEFKPVNANILYTGVGKVKAAMATQWLIDHYDVEKIINVGTAGSNTSGEFHTGICQIDSIKERDFIVPGNDEHIIEITNDEGFFHYICCTGDSFVSDWEGYKETDCADMEAYAIAYVCQQNKISFECYKFISDNGNIDDWEQSLEQCNKAFGQYFNLEVK